VKRAFVGTIDPDSIEQLFEAGEAREAVEEVQEL
jgi:hypothetical protein